MKHPNISEFSGLVKLVEMRDPAMKRRMYSTGNYQKPLRNLMALVIKCSNIVATTPVTSSSFLYRSYNSEVARGVIFDKAATLFCSDSLLVLGNTPRPMIMFGDTKQLAPVLRQVRQNLRPQAILRTGASAGRSGGEGSWIGVSRTRRGKRHQPIPR